MSKAEYLKRYSSKKEIKDKRGKKEKKKNNSKKEGPQLIVDNDDWGASKEEEGHSFGENGEESPELASSTAMRQRGAWQTEEETLSTSGGGMVEQSASESDSDADVPRKPIRTRHDSDSSDMDIPRRPTKTRHDSDSDSSSDMDVPRRPTEKLSAAGQKTGLISSKEFKSVEEELRKKREEEMLGIDEVAMGKGRETVYRDEGGNKVDSMSEYLRKEAVDKGIAIRLEKAQKNIGQGGVQQRERQAMMDEMEKVAQEGFSRGIDNDRVEVLRKEQLREGDPMAEYFSKKQKNSKKSSSYRDGDRLDSTSGRGTNSEAPSKPRYSGPPPAPNRFSIIPGFRWDAVDRGNHYEAKVLLMLNKSKEEGERHYRASTADM